MPYTRLAQAVLLIITLSWGSVPVHAAGSSGDGPPEVESASPKDGLPDDGEKKTDPVSVVTGSVHKETVDLYLPDRIPLQLDRTYRSADVYEHLGYNWRFNYHSRLIERPEANAIWEVDEHNYLWKHVDNLDGTYVPPKGRRERILRLPDGSYIVRGPHGRQRRYAPADSKGIARLVSISDTYGNTLTLTYHNDGQRLRRVTSPSGKWMDFEYDDHSKVTRVTDSAGRAVTYEYDRFGRLITVVKPGGRTTRYEYGSGPQTRLIVAEIGPTGNTWRHVYDEKGRAITVIAPDWSTVSFDYDPANKRTTLKWENGAREVYHYDDDANTVKVEGPGDRRISREYDDNKQLISYTDAAGSETRLAYDPAGNLSRISDTTGRVVTYEYDHRYNRPTAVTDAVGARTTYEYDEKGGLVRSVDPLGAVTTYRYDDMGRMTEHRDAEGGVSRFGYYEDGLLKSYSDPLGRTTLMTYDVYGCLATVTDPAGHKRSYRHDEAGKRVSMTDALGAETRYEYDATGRMIGLTDANGNTTRFEYNSRGKLTAQVYPDGSKELYEYDVRRNLISKTNPDGTILRYEYDAHDRLIRKTRPEDVTEYIYDDPGRLVAVKNPMGETRFTYDPMGRVLTAAYPSGKTVGYEYDAQGRRSKLIYPDGYTVSYLYDPAGRLARIDDSTGQTIARYSYDKRGRRVRLDYANETSITYRYDAAGQLLNVTNHVKPEELSYTYAYDVSGNVTQASLPVGRAVFAYDAAGQLTKETIGPDERAYSYDDVGNILTTSNTYPDVDLRLKSDAASGASAQLDKLGNLVVSRASRYAFDSESRLLSANDGERSVSYAYDYAGRRVRTDDYGGHSAKLSYLYDGHHAIMIYDGDSDDELKRYVYGPGLDAPVYMRNKEDNFYYYFDSRNNVTALTDSTAQIRCRYEYSAFGSSIHTSHGDGPAVDNDLRFAARETDERLGLVYMRNRYYAPEIGRFLSRDPWGYLTGTNLYAYVSNNPLKYFDPLGLARIIVNVVGRGGDSLTGHAWITVENDSGKAVSIGNYPGGPVVEGSDRSPDTSRGWEVPQDRADAALEAMNQDGYDLFTDNCVDRIEDALDAAGIEYPSFDTFGISDPAKLKEWLDGLNEGDLDGLDQGNEEDC